jgi:O-antigen ligase
VDFALFIVVTAILFIRPTDFIPALADVPLYLIAILPCILLSWHKLVPQLTAAGLRERPVLALAMGILVLAIISCLLHGQLQTAFDFSTAWVKIPTLYWLMLAQIDSPRRLKFYVGWLVAIIAVPVLLAVLHYDGYINISAFELPSADGGDAAASEGGRPRRLQGTGNFSDPNDICELVNCALVFSLYGLLDRRRPLGRLLWLAPIALFGRALALTQSRGGLLALVVGVVVLLRSRFRGTKLLLLAGTSLAALLLLFGGGRQTSISTSEGTSQQRIQIWDTGFEMLKRSPLIGIGMDQFRQGSGADHVAHNAFVQLYTELGLIGGTLFFGQYYYCLINLKALGSRTVTLPDAEMRRLQPFLLAAMAGFATSEMSLTNGLTVVTYVMFGLTTAFIRLADPSPPLVGATMNGRLFCRIVFFSGLFLASLYAFTKYSVRYG